MPYQYSRARKQFISDLVTIYAALRDAYSGQCSSSIVRGFALCSAVILTSAKVESYLETLVSDWGKAILSNSITTEKLPLHTRAFLLNDPAIETAYMKFGFQRNESEFLPEIGSMIGQPVLLFGKDGEHIPPFQVNRVYKDSKYPSPTNIRKLFRRCGIDSVFHKLNSIAKTDVEALITSFNDVRTEMAHEGMPPGLSVSDVRARIKGAASVVGYIDRLFYRQVCQTTGAVCWTK